MALNWDVLDDHWSKKIYRPTMIVWWPVLYSSQMILFTLTNWALALWWNTGSDQRPAHSAFLKIFPGNSFHIFITAWYKNLSSTAYSAVWWVLTWKGYWQPGRGGRHRQAQPELQKRADRADQSVLFFLAGANFWEKHAKNRRKHAKTGENTRKQAKNRRFFGANFLGGETGRC